MKSLPEAWQQRLPAMDWSKFRVLSLFWFMSGHVLAQTPSKEIDQAMKAIDDGKLLQGIVLLEPLVAKDEMARELLGQIYSFVGEYEEAKALRPAAAAAYRTDLPTEFELTDAVEAIASESIGRRIVIINEAHDAPEHRNFISRVAARLKQNGFTHYAFETLAEDPMQLLARGYPVRPTGMYSQEPQFGELIRDSLKLGFVPIRYEAEDVQSLADPIDKINRREAAQCQNLVDRIFSMNSEARVLIHVGLDHVIEEPKKVGEKEILWLAARLKKLTGIDPLTIDQITSLDSARAGHDLPVVGQNAQGMFFVGGPFRTYVDMQVYHPKRKLQTGRSDWLTADVTRKLVDVPQSIQLTDEGRLLVHARPINEQLDAIPSDQVLLEPGAPRTKLSLRPGTFKVETQNDRGAILHSVEVVVE